MELYTFDFSFLKADSYYSNHRKMGSEKDSYVQASFSAELLSVSRN